MSVTKREKKSSLENKEPILALKSQFKCIYSTLIVYKYRIQVKNTNIDCKHIVDYRDIDPYTS